jgi:hypothetical protein
MRFSIIRDLVKAEEVRAEDFDEMIHVILYHDWSPSIFKNNYRKKENFESTNMMVLDIDSGPTYDEAQLLFKEYDYLITTTRNHRKLKNGIVCDRYRVILKLESQISDNFTFDATWQSLYDKFPFIDKACKDSSRMYYKSIGDPKPNNGKQVKVIKAKQKSYDNTVKDLRGFYPPSYLYAKNWGVPQGRRNDTVFRISCELFRCGYIEDEVNELINAITDLPEYEIARTVKSAAQAVLK